MHRDSAYFLSAILSIGDHLGSAELSYACSAIIRTVLAEIKPSAREAISLTRAGDALVLRIRSWNFE